MKVSKAVCSHIRKRNRNWKTN